MSTKIFNTFKLKKENLTIHELFLISDIIREVLKEKQREIILDMAYKTTCNFLDKKIYKKENILEDEKIKNILEYNLPLYVYEKLQRKYNKVKHNLTRTPEDIYDFSVSVCFFEYNNNIYLKLFCGYYEKDFMNSLKELDILEEYDYWNNTDKPDNISNEEWKERALVWENIFKKSSIPNEVALNLDITSDFIDFISKEDILKYNTEENIQKRKETIYKRILEKEFLLKQKEQHTNNEEVALNYIDFINSLDTNELKEKAHKLEIIDITEELLEMSLKDIYNTYV